MDNASEKYARALAGSAVQAGLLAEARKDFDRLMSMLSSSKELRFVLMRRGFSSEDEKKALKSVLEKEVSDLFLKFLDVVIEKRRGPLISKIKQKFDAMADAAEGDIKAELDAAFPVDETSKKELAKVFSSKTGRTVAFKENHDKRLLGGARLRIADRVIDATLAARLEMMRKELCSC